MQEKGEKEHSMNSDEKATFGVSKRASSMVRNQVMLLLGKSDYFTQISTQEQIQHHVWSRGTHRFH